MTKVAKVTVSLPTSLFEFVEQQRQRSGASRSETIAEMLWHVRHEAEISEREARYEAAYESKPETSEELALAEAASRALAGDSEAWTEADSPRGGRAVRNPRRVSSTRTAATAGSKSRGTRSDSAGTPKAGKRASG
ncbi:MAG: hypothetical protein ACRDV4_07165 [Acidimicrobiales bacterium]